MKGRPVVEDDELESEYSYLPGKKLKKRKKKKKKPKKEPGINDRDLLMAQAYGGISSNMANKYRQVLKEGGKLNQSAISGTPMERIGTAALRNA